MRAKPDSVPMLSGRRRVGCLQFGCLQTRRSVGENLLFLLHCRVHHWQEQVREKNIKGRHSIGGVDTVTLPLSRSKIRLVLFTPTLNPVFRLT